jgi:hypothetical protein
MALAPATSVFGLIGFSGKVGRETDQLAILAPLEKHYGDDWWYRTQLAFAQIELQRHDEGLRNIEIALEGFPRSAHAAHIRAHLFYELGEREAGLAYLTDWTKDYAREGLLHCHISWHVALWSLETGRRKDAWRVYDEALRPGAAWGPQINVLTDCAAFLARAEVAADMMAPLARGFDAFARGDWSVAVGEIEPLLATHERLGGSRAQRDLLEYLVTSAMVRAGRAADAHRQISTRRPQNGKSGFPVAGL